jgi:hypothetical protein
VAGQDSKLESTIEGVSEAKAIWEEFDREN